MSDQTAFFVDGGTLPIHTPSYVTRAADQELLRRALEGAFCYVLTARQMGKSSLMVRTALGLRRYHVKTALVDLTSIGIVSANEWYLGLLMRIKNDLRIPIDLHAWWRARQDLSAPHRFIDFLHDVLLVHTEGAVVVFIDEIDTTLSLDFRDDFFAVLRAMYNARASDPTYNRLTFVLLGVATPTDLIRDRERTPFNIGRRIVLREFSLTEAAPLCAGLEQRHPGYGERILRRIFYWTGGHPYLTQKLCVAVAQLPRRFWTDAMVDGLVDAIFLSDTAGKDTNFTYIEDRIRDTAAPERRRILKLYSDVYREKYVPSDDRSAAQNRLELFGLVVVDEGRLRLRNRIYREVFDVAWMKKYQPINRTRIVVAGATIVILAALALALFFMYSGTLYFHLQSVKLQ
jgi:hypothetical protein